MKKQYLLVMILGIIAIMLFAGCSDDNGANGGGNGNGNGDDPSGKYLIWANLGPDLLMSNFEASVWAMDTTDVSPIGCDFTVNGEEIPYLFTLDSTDAYFFSTSVGYEISTSYSIVVSLGGKSATCNFTTPATPVAAEVDITSPASESFFTPGDNIDLTWTISGGTAEDIHISVWVDEEDEYIFEENLSGTATSYTISGATTAGWSEYYEFDISVDLGEYIYPFTGELAELGSFTVLVLPGDCVFLYNEEGDTIDPPDTIWSTFITFDSYYLDANGTSSTQVHAFIDDNFYNTCPDNTPVIFSVSPSGLVSFDPVTAYTSGGTATATITAGTTHGDATITATSSYGSDDETLYLIEDIELELFVSGGATPTISWTPTDQNMIGLFVRRTGVGINNMWTIGGAGFSSPVAYGDVPSGATQAYPLGGAAPDPLESGTTYTVGIVNMLGDTTSTSYSF